MFRKFLTAIVAVAAVSLLSTAAYSECAKHKDCSKKAECTPEKAAKCETKDTCCKQTASKDPTEQDVVLDPVCGMDVEAKTAKLSSKFKGKTYRFCSESCKKSFDKDPAKFIGKGRKCD
ncbi:MAG TPA: YHS domain-containing protein [Nitrospirota bacterium]|nr:YHS domain-containing protein [Nitrospirota bacterium]